MQLGCAERTKTQINNIKKTKNKSVEVITVSLVIEIKKMYKKKSLLQREFADSE